MPDYTPHKHAWIPNEEESEAKCSCGAILKGGKVWRGEA